MTGGAGYIGAHVVRALMGADLRVVVLDDLSAGRAGRLPPTVPLIRADVRDRMTVRDAIIRYHVSGVIHLAALKDVAASYEDPLGYHRANLDTLADLLEVLVDLRTPHLVFSSTAAVYGTADSYAEDAPTRPSSPYGRTKLAGEWLIGDVGAATGLNHAILRFFNVAGAGAPALADTGGDNLLPRLLRAAVEGGKATVHGTGHPTPDGSCVRDYVHPSDIAGAHVAAVRALEAGGLTADTLNVSRGVGVSVLELIAAVERATGQPLPYVVGEPRPGDPPTAVADPARIRDRLGWRAQRSLDDIVGSAWAATAAQLRIARQRRPHDVATTL
ncbi:UDP-glucose 4-epimerase GalE [Longispora fulva]|uniref:UDP-glucose 4-epimerase GalE n=1 Tax=Longispora fulva TaxID=619741 RepID=UPI002277BF8B|nr:UDP-glucose 4-epimerase GalE [Longispora fulva]